MERALLIEECESKYIETNKEKALMNFRKMGIATAAALLVSGPATAGFIDFEDAAGGLADNASLTTEYQGSDDVSFVGAFLEAAGQTDTSPHGFLNDQTNVLDDEFPSSPGLGNWFVRSGGELTIRGGQGVYLSILYGTAVTAAMGQI